MTDKNRNTAQILVVDDEPDLRELLVDALSNSGVTVSAAGNGKEAIELARRIQPDIVVTDLCLGDCSGLDVIDRIGDIPTVVITGQGDAASLTEASRCRPLELMTKPLNIERLRNTISRELDRLADSRQNQQGHGLLRKTCTGMTREYRELSSQLMSHQVLLRYQAELIAAKADDDVFRAFFQTFVRQSTPVCGAALVCDANAELRITGRFGVPRPDELEFCRHLSDPMIDLLLNNPSVQYVDAGDEPEIFDESVRRYLPGLSLLAIPLIPDPGEMIGVIMLYRKGEQPFTEDDIDLAQIIAYPTALAVRRND